MRKTGLLVTVAMVTFFVAAVIPAGAKPGAGSGSGKAPKLSFSSATYSRSESGVKATLLIKKSGQSKNPTTVQVSTAGGTATPGADYTAINHAVVIAANAATSPVEIQIANDSLHEGPETVEVHLGPPIVNGQLQSPKIATLTIVDDEVTTIDAADTSATEGNDLVFNVTLSDPATIPISANWATSPGSATSPGDFPPANGQVTFGPGDTSENVNVPTTNDTTDEPAQDMTLTLSALSAAASAGDLVGMGTINDNDGPPVVFVSNNPSTTEGGNLVYDVALSEASEKVASVDIDDDPVSAAAPGDYTANSATLTWNPGDPLTQQFTLSTVDDTGAEPTEVVWGLLSNPVNAVEYADPDDFDNFESAFFTGDSYGRGTIDDNCTEDGNEENDTNGTATAGSPGGIQQGIACQGDDDLYSYNLTAGDFIDIDVLHSFADGDIDIILRDPTDSIVTFDQDVDDDANVDHTATMSGTYVLEIRQCCGDTGPNEGAPYTLDVGVNENIQNFFANGNPNAIPGSGSIGAGSLYPWDVTASGMDGTITDVDVHVDALSHTFPNDLEMLLVAPTGETVLLMSDVGGVASASGVNLVFDDAAGGPVTSPLASGTYTPTDIAAGPCLGDTGFPASAPAGPYGATLGSLNGIAPNGTWSLFVYDDCSVDTGQALRWSLHLTTTG